MLTGVGHTRRHDGLVAQTLLQGSRVTAAV
jgi:hypothetical protein